MEENQEKDMVSLYKALSEFRQNIKQPAKDQLDNLARYCVQAGINVIKASDRETIIE